MKKSTLDTALIVSALLSPVAPGLVSKELVMMSFSLLIVKILVSGNILRYIKEKVITILFFLPGTTLALLNSPSDMLRFFPVLFLVLGFPYRGFKLNHAVIAYASILVIGYLFVTQLLIAFGNPSLISFRNDFYPIEHDAWRYRDIGSLFFPFGTFRAAGVFYNPNVQGLVLILYFFVYSILHSSIRPKNKKLIFSDWAYYILLAIVFYSIFITGSRTALMSLIFYILLKEALSNGMFKISKKIKWTILLLASAPAIWFFLWDRLMQGFTDPMGSANIKLRILFDYLQASDLATLLFGGTYDLQFDAEYGYWIGAAGICGVIGWVLTLRLFFSHIPSSRAISLAMLLMAIGNTVFYGLMTGAIATLLLVTACTLTPKANRRFAGWNYPAEHCATSTPLTHKG